MFTHFPCTVKEEVVWDSTDLWEDGLGPLPVTPVFKSIINMWAQKGTSYSIGSHLDIDLS